MRDTSIYEFAETAKGFTGNPLGIIALFLVLVYGFATLTFLFADNLHDSADYMVWFLIIFPFVAFFGFLWLVSKHHAKLYGPKDFRNDHDFLRLPVCRLPLPGKIKIHGKQMDKQQTPLIGEL